MYGVTPQAYDRTITVSGVSKSYSMTQQDPLDNNYMDGCSFIFTTDLEVGTYNFHFNCSDDEFSANIGPFLGPIVESRIRWDQLSLTGIQIGGIVTHGEKNPITEHGLIVNQLIQRGATVIIQL